MLSLFTAIALSTGTANQLFKGILLRPFLPILNLPETRKSCCLAGMRSESGRQ